jgi:predicted metal-dependent phosphoesterase TrpH
MLKKVDCIEVFNSRISQHENLRAQQLASELGHPVLAGSDAHFYFEIGNSGVIVNDCVSDLEDLKKAILKKNTKVYGKLTPVPSQIFSKFALKMRTRVSDRFTTSLFSVFR